MLQFHVFMLLPIVLSLASCATASRPSSVPDATLADPALARRLGGALDTAVREGRIVGGVLLVARDGELVYHRAVGDADREAGIAMQEDAIFRLASVSKPIVSIATLALAERGTLLLDEDVTRYLPDFRPRLEDGTEATITIRQLLTHTSGLGYCFMEAEDGPYHRVGVSDGLDGPGRTFEENARRLASVPLRAQPGAAFHYSLSTDVLGEVIARAGGSTLPEVVSRLVTGPLGLRDTGFVVMDTRRLAAAYANGKDRPNRMQDGHQVPFGASTISFAPSRVFNSQSYPSGGAGMVGTARDVLRFLEAIRTGGRGVVSPNTAHAAIQDQLGDADAVELGAGVGFGFIGSVILDPVRAGSCANPGTVRWGGAYGHTWFLDPTDKLTVVLLTNTTLEGMSGRLPQDIEHAVYGH